MLSDFGAGFFSTLPHLSRIPGEERERGGEREREGRSERAREGGSERGERQAGRFRKCERGQGVGSGSVKYGPHEESTKC